tara:strand:- start:2328 stop:3308 length:981 start_codon:yes stop_codon:yes gene_type:complete
MLSSLAFHAVSASSRAASVVRTPSARRASRARAPRAPAASLPGALALERGLGASANSARATRTSVRNRASRARSPTRMAPRSAVDASAVPFKSRVLRPINIRDRLKTHTLLGFNADQTFISNAVERGRPRARASLAQLRARIAAPRTRERRATRRDRRARDVDAARRRARDDDDATTTTTTRGVGRRDGDGDGADADAKRANAERVDADGDDRDRALRGARRRDAGPRGVHGGRVLRRVVGADGDGDEGVHRENRQTGHRGAERAPAVRGRVREGVLGRGERGGEHVGGDDGAIAEADERGERALLVERGGGVRDVADGERGTVVL